MTDERIGVVRHYWPKASAAEIEVREAVVRTGDRLRLKGHGHDFLQTVESIRVDENPRPYASPGTPFTIGVDQPVHRGDDVYLVRDTGGPKE